MDKSGESPSSINQCWYLFLFISVFSIDAHRAPINHWRMCCVILQIDFSPNLSAWMPRWRAGWVECGFPATIGGPDPEIWNDLLAGRFFRQFLLMCHPSPPHPTQKDSQSWHDLIGRGKWERATNTKPVACNNRYPVQENSKLVSPAPALKQNTSATGASRSRTDHWH